ncbi:MAG TPA: CoA ester lyase [Thermoanaerobaculia bacterium]|nr:CoA ester lyase [Thermoanaerobaculia bacterium]
MTCALYVERYGRAGEVGADIGTVDLEDSVPAPAREEARRLALPFFMEARGAGGADGWLRTLRINNLRSADGLRDILALVESGARPPALLVPKVDSAQDLLILEELLQERLPSTIFLVVIETAAGLAAVDEIAAATPRVRALVFGGADFSADLGTTMEWEHLLYARSRILVAAARAGIPAMDSPCFEIRNAEALRSEILRSQRLGFAGKAAVHPRQVALINEGFTPAPEAVRRARRILASIEERGGQIVVLDGEMIGPPAVIAARRMLALAERIEAVEKTVRV